MKNSTLELIHHHGSVRQYKTDPVSREMIETIVAAGQRASTSSNLQMFSVVALTDVKKRAQMPPFLLRLGKGSGDIILLRHVAGQGQRVGMPACRFLKRLGIAADQPDVPARLKKDIRRRLADAPARAGDDDGFDHAVPP